MFIAFEGPDGSGKTSRSKELAEWMGAEWRCFPDRRTPIGKLIDGHLKGYWKAQQDTDGPQRRVEDAERAWFDAHGSTMDALMFQGLQLANRAEVATDIVSTLRSGKSIVCDRYWGSGYAYGKADGIDPSYLMKIHSFLPDPALNVLLDVPTEISVKRLAGRGGVIERYEGSVEFLETVAKNYRELWASRKSDPRWVVVDGSGTPEQTLLKLKALIPQAVLTK